VREFGVEVGGRETREVGPGGGPCLEFIVSTGAVDRYNEIIEPRGWKLENYRRNPVFLNGHRNADVLFVLGRALETEIVVRGDGSAVLWQKVEFATHVSPMAKIAYGLFAGGYLNSVSVGFLPIRYEEGTEKTGWSRRHIEQELLEVSAVAIPANPEAHAVARRGWTPADTARAAEWLALMGGEAAAAQGKHKRNCLEACRELVEFLRPFRDGRSNTTER